MEALAILLLIGLAVYFFFKDNTRRGANTVRSYLYLRAIRRGASEKKRTNSHGSM